MKPFLLKTLLLVSTARTTVKSDNFRNFADTSRPSRPGEIHGKDYFFDTREQMQIDVEAGKFIEHGEYRGNLYGTSTDGVRDLIASGLQPIVSPHYQVVGLST